VVLDGRIWLTTALEDERSLRAIAVDAVTGTILHDVEVFHPAAWQASHPENSYASPTPVLEPGRVYVHFGAYGTACLTTGGEVLWRNLDVDADYEVGPGSSPILWQDLLIVNVDAADQRYVAAFHKDTGKLAWRAERSVSLEERKGTHRKAFSTPIVVDVGGVPELISAGASQVSAYWPATGQEIWRVRFDGYSVVPQPSAGLGFVFVDTGYIKPRLLAIRLGGRGDLTDTHVAWDYYWQVPANPSPLLIGDRIFMVSDWGIATWIDARGGGEDQDRWRHRLEGEFRASPVVAGGRIYAFNVDGRAWVIAAEDAYRELAVNQLDAVVRTTPAFVGPAIFVRSEDHLYRLGE